MKGKVSSGDLRNARRFDDGRAALAFGKAGGFVFIGVDAAEGFAIGVVHGHQKVVVTAAAIFAEFRFFVPDGFAGLKRRFGRSFGCRFSHEEASIFQTVNRNMTIKATTRK